MNFEKALEEEIAKNAELRKVFEEHPERKAMYIAKVKDIWEERAGYEPPKPIYCETCVFAHGAPPYADMPRKANCEMYPVEDGVDKPNAVLLEGAKCPFYEKES